MGGVAQLGERLNGIQEVRGSIPLASIARDRPKKHLKPFLGLKMALIVNNTHAGIAQLVEHNLAKVGVAGSSPVSRLRQDASGAVRMRSWYPVRPGRGTRPSAARFPPAPGPRAMPVGRRAVGRLAQLVRAPR